MFKKGNTPHNKGERGIYIPSKQAIEKVRLANTGRVFTEEHKRNISIGKMGKRSSRVYTKLSEESKEKIRNSDYHRNLSGSGNPMFGRINRWGRHTREDREQYVITRRKNYPDWVSDKNQYKRQGESLRKFYLAHPEKHPNVIMSRSRRYGKGHISKGQWKLFDILAKTYPDAVINHPIKSEGHIELLRRE